MSVHLVGLHRPAGVRLSGTIQLRHTRVVHGRVEPCGPLDEGAFESARVDCQRGAGPKRGEQCLACPRLLRYERGERPGDIDVICSWGDCDPVAARMTCARALVSVPSATSCAEAAAIAARAGIHHLLIIDEGRLIGVVSRQDLTAAPEAPISSVMAREVFAIAPSSSLGEAAAAMRALDIGSLPVIADGLLVGILTLTDLGIAAS